jgi:spore coat polysaccharide biosynthesis predicted glycosyltransferase SpsG
MSARVLLRAHSGPRAGLGHVVRTLAVAEELRARGGAGRLVVDDPESAAVAARAGFEVVTADASPAWADDACTAAWVDTFTDCSEELRVLARRGTPIFLVENRTPARELATWIVQPKLYVDPDEWETRHAARILRGPEWIPLGREVRAQAPCERDLDVLVTFGGSDPLESTERVLATLPDGLRVAVAIGAHMHARRPAIARAAGRLEAELLPTQTPLAPWMARARAAVTALGTTLFELAHLRTPALVLANFAADAPVLAFCAAATPFRPLGLAGELDDAALAARLAAALADLRAPAAAVPGLGDGAARLAARLLAPAAHPAHSLTART